MRRDTKPPSVGQAGHRHSSRRLRLCWGCPEKFLAGELEGAGGAEGEEGEPRWGWRIDRNVQGAWNTWEATRAWVGQQPRPYYLGWVGKADRRGWEREGQGLRNLALEAREHGI